MIANLLLAVSGSIILLLGLLTLISNPKKRVNRAFFAFAISGFLWLLMNLFANASADPVYSLLFVRMSTAASAFIALTFLIFCLSYTGDRRLTKRHIAKLSILPILISLASPTSLNVTTIESYGREVKTGPLYFVLIPFLLLYFTKGFFVLYRYYQAASSVQRARLRYLFIGFVFTIVPGIIINGILPVIGYDEASYYGPSIVVILAFFMSIAIARLRLLNIRLVAVRSLVYTLIIFSMAAVFFIVAFTIGTFTAGGQSLSLPLQMTYIGLALLLSFVFQPLKSFFDKLSNRYFYRDAYETEDFLGELNRTVVSNVDIDVLLDHTSQIIEKYLKSGAVIFDMNQTAYVERRIISNNQTYDELNVDAMHEALSGVNERVTVVDDLEYTNNELYELLQSKNISLVVHLTTNLEYHVMGFGYLLIGTKKSGNPYTSQDINVVRIMAGELAIAIQNALRFEEIEKFNTTLQEKIDDSTRKLRRTNDKLKSLDETKDEFISMASHQLRTPLTSVKGYLSMVIEGDAGELNEMQQKLLGQAFTSSQRMVYLIADLLNLSRLRTGKFIIEAVPTNLANVISGELDQLREAIGAKNMKLTYEPPQDFPTLLMDETKIRQALMNFIDNAIYYTPAGGNIEISLKEKKETIEFTVKDDGIGVPKAEQQHLFNKFYRAGNARKARPDGTGLGLFMAKKVVIAQGGALIFTSKENKGSTFGFTFAKKRLALPVAAQTTEHSDSAQG